ncbi:MAG: helix-turn-helix domain-containing protein, partial [Acetatifactor sp.]|nr:helix-turn-helix domain-containing protein [Acetatifactor sp.]
MLDSTKIGNFIAAKRKNLGLTQQQLADKLNISFQAISKWENGSAYPKVEILDD